MASEIVVAILALVGTTIGSLAGVMTANKLTVYRIDQLEKKVDQYNNVKDRTTCLERDLKTAFNMIGEIKEELKHE